MTKLLSALTCALLLTYATAGFAQEPDGDEPAVSLDGMDAAQLAWLVGVEEQECFVSPDGLTTMLLAVNPETTPAAQATFSLMRAAPDARVPEHIHELSDEMIFVQQASGMLYFDGAWRTIDSGEVIYIPAGTPHAYQNDGDDDMIAMQVYVGPGPEDRFRGWAPCPTP